MPRSANWNVNIPTGTLYGPHSSYNVQVNGQLMKAVDYEPLIVTYRNGAPVRLARCRATSWTASRTTRTSPRFMAASSGADGVRGVNLMVMRQPGSNTIAVTDKVKELLPTFQAQMPPSVHLAVRGDRSKNIREAFQDIQFTMAATLALVIMVIFLFLRNLLGHPDSRRWRCRSRWSAPSR